MFIKFDNKRASFKDGNLLVGYSQATLPEDPIIDPPVIDLLNFPKYEFNDVGTVYNALYPEDRLILILRHGHRTTVESSDGITSEYRLTKLGEAQCKLVGSKLEFNNAFPKDNSKYLSSDTDRTKKTCYYIMEGRGDKLYENKNLIPSKYEYNPRTEGMLTGLNEETNILGSEDYESLPGSIATKPSGGWQKVTNYAFGLNQDVDADLSARKIEKDNMSHIFLNKIISISNKKINIYASHDYKIIPLISTFTDIPAFDFQAMESGFDISDNKNKNGKWLNYLSGLACVIHSNEVREYIPVKGLSVGYSYSWPESHAENWTGPTGNFEWSDFLT